MSPVSGSSDFGKVGASIGRPASRAGPPPAFAYGCGFSSGRGSNEDMQEAIQVHCEMPLEDVLTVVHYPNFSPRMFCLKKLPHVV